MTKQKVLRGAEKAYNDYPALLEYSQLHGGVYTESNPIELEQLQEELKSEISYLEISKQQVREFDINARASLSEELADRLYDYLLHEVVESIERREKLVQCIEDCKRWEKNDHEQQQ